ncbi:hypothetical protein AC578_6015 [Pseudocercospora eumusae]|uniref:Uncharacterized protein n=1 Tax=Pseudocercospora eumusae TaxID=321146 RepID=A0A139HVI9_9PEZI|nr:hypothetical protein AC578_6015 [Pseudocercospora eumusae]
MGHSKFAAISSATDSTRVTAASVQDISRSREPGMSQGWMLRGPQVSPEQRNLVSTQNDKAMTVDASKEKSSLPGAGSSAASSRLSSSRPGANDKHRSNEQDIYWENGSQGRKNTYFSAQSNQIQARKMLIRR